MYKIGSLFDGSGGFPLAASRRGIVPTWASEVEPYPIAVTRSRFPDKWGHPDKKESLSDEEYAFWMAVRNTHAAINGKSVREYTADQMLSWYNKLHTDSAEYKMWGNGIALPPALYVMQGISDALEEGKA